MIYVDTMYVHTVYLQLRGRSKDVSLDDVCSARVNLVHRLGVELNHSKWLHLQNWFWPASIATSTGTTCF